jgi:hypothetical protein
MACPSAPHQRRRLPSGTLWSTCQPSSNRVSHRCHRCDALDAPSRLPPEDLFVCAPPKRPTLVGGHLVSGAVGRRGGKGGFIDRVVHIRVLTF